ncbi:MAG: cytochrome c [Planctomycetaceae bacterium]|nr:cytochrome c [Planctomycetaceae bacterium]
MSQQTPAAKPVIENIHPLTPQLISGGQPKGDAAFSKLAEMGVKTVVSVDGAKPDLELAKKHGLRYVHIPIGYDGVDAEAQGALTRVMREAQGPIFIHCHHGKHRGPAAAVIACMAAGDMPRERAAEFMKLAGTGKEYTGLWRDVAAFQPLPADAKLPPLVEAVQEESLAGAMAGLDRAWDGLKLCEAAGWKTPANHADLAPAHQALLVWEGLTESRRMAENSDPQLVKWLDEAVSEAAQLRQSVQAGDGASASRQFRQVEAACARCHEQYRN